ncbi:hypothetical protein U3A58_09310 [Algoriphagus sp. C2-6-M1]|nr:hypothetical protein [Algoriphagus sp. C2-6-M1]MEB2780592.1 hypothetical protein [Algoriphagus sp. C2-6-M1]
MSKATQSVMIINHARFSRIEFGIVYPVSLVTGQVMTFERKI